MILPVNSFSDIRSLNIVERTNEFFGPSSPLRTSHNYEERPPQKTMALKVAEAFEEGKNLCVEAPTGIGKSYAYLVPSVFLAKAVKLPVLISTETITLQEQLINKDIPVLQRLIPGGFSAALAKGRGRYLCLRRFFLCKEKIEEDLFNKQQILELHKIERWLAEGGSGEESDINLLEKSVWYLICCEAGNCRGQQCQHFKSCYYWRARSLWEKADILVANHALFFSNWKIVDKYEYSLLPEYCALVLDEAHTIENEATSNSGIHLTKNAIIHFLKTLYDPETSKGFLVKGGTGETEARGMVADLIKLSNVYFNQFDAIFEKVESDTFRFRKPGLIQDMISEPLFKLAGIFSKIVENRDDEDFKQEFSALSLKTEAFADAIRKFSSMELENYVYWAEKSEKYQNQIEIFACPIDVKDILTKCVFDTPTPSILTSATLSVNDSMDYFCNRINYHGGEVLKLDTMFDYQKQMKVHISKRVPEPDSENYIEILCGEIKKYIELTHGKAFVLFTNYEHLNACANQLREFFYEKNITLLVHGEGMSRKHMIENFKKDINSVIFGAASFWSGVDVPGEALSSVIITKLPFMVPTHPLVEARSEELRKQGVDPFKNYQLPEAVLRFKQGIGRLIRTKTDTGIVVILDKRIITKGYGHIFQKAIPKCERIIAN